MSELDPLPRHANGIVLRRLRASDIKPFQAYRADPEVYRYQGWLPMSDADAAQFLAQMATARLFQPGVWAQIGISDPHTDALMGDLGVRLSEACLEVEIGITLHRQYQGRGLASIALREAIDMLFEHTPAARALCISDARNSRSLRLLERIGMRKIGSHTAVFRGEPCVEHSYVLNRCAAP